MLSQTVDQALMVQRIMCSEVLKEVNPLKIRRIVRAGNWYIIEQGDFVYKQGDRNGHFYIIAEGQVELSMALARNEQMVISRIGPGGSFGETSLLTDNSNCLSARALTRLTLLGFSAKDFFSQLMTDHTIEKRLCVILAERLRLSFHDHAHSLAGIRRYRDTLKKELDPSFLPELNPAKVLPQPTQSVRQPVHLPESLLSRQIAAAVLRFKDHLGPVLLTGEVGTGRRLVAHEIHKKSKVQDGPYTEVDIACLDPETVETDLFGSSHDVVAFSQIDHIGIFGQFQGGTIVLYNIEYLASTIQRRLAAALREKSYLLLDGTAKIMLDCRIILICTDKQGQPDGCERLHPELFTVVKHHHFTVAPLRNHRRDIPQLINYYLRKYSNHYGKSITHVDENTLGMFINYDWPGNLNEMASVIQRAVIIAKTNGPLSEENLLGVPRPEGKWEYNLLRLKAFRAVFTSWYFPVLPRAIVGIFLVVLFATLFFGPQVPEKNIGLTLSWIIGWPLLSFGFFFFGRIWCSICGLSVPGWLAQTLIKPNRPTPTFIKRYSSWIVIFLCVFLFWLEIVFDAYSSPLITGSILLAITCGALFFSMFFKRRVWCRYLCPLGGINAVFSMPSILELRANTHMCVNHCPDHRCYSGDDEAVGCPMFRHPFLVDNNRDCILCGQCAKNCQHNSIHLNLRLAPQELWNQQSPRFGDSILVVCLGAILIPFTIHAKYPESIHYLAELLKTNGYSYGFLVASNIIFVTCLLACLVGYISISIIIAHITTGNWTKIAATLGYGMIPLILGAFMAIHMEIFFGNFDLLIDNLRDIFGAGGRYLSRRILSKDAVFILQLLSITGGLFASLYATRRIMAQLQPHNHPHVPYALQATLLFSSAALYLKLC